MYVSFCFIILLLYYKNHMGIVKLSYIEKQGKEWVEEENKTRIQEI